ncbi:MAG: site-specific integrase [Candidatus Caldarchaeum sp.]
MAFAYPALDFDEALGKYLGCSKAEALSKAKAYKAHLLSAGKSLATVNACLSHLKSFVKVLHKGGMLDWTLDALDLERQRTSYSVRLSQKLPIQDEAKLVKLIKSITRKPKGLPEYRTTIAAQLMLWHGLRASEVVGVSFEQIQPDGTCTIHGKGNKVRQIQLRPETLSLIQSLKALYEAEGLEPKPDALGTPVLITLRKGKGQRISYDTLARIAKALLKAHGVERKGIACHSLRHTFATIAIRHADILSVAAQLGHANIATTQAYLHTLKTPTVAKALPIGGRERSPGRGKGQSQS